MQGKCKCEIYPSMILYRKFLDINRASDGIRTRDLSITNRLHYLCATLAKAEVVRECENGSFAMTIYREAASRIIFSIDGSASFTTAWGPVIFT